MEIETDNGKGNVGRERERREMLLCCILFW